MLDVASQGKKVGIISLLLLVGALWALVEGVAIVVLILSFISGILAGTSVILIYLYKSGSAMMDMITETAFQATQPRENEDGGEE